MMLKSPTPTGRLFILFSRLVDLGEWFFRSLRWRVLAVWHIFDWLVLHNASFDPWIWRLKNRGEFIKHFWKNRRELEFPRHKIYSPVSTIRVEVIKFRTTHELRPVAMCTDGKIRPIEEIN